VGLITSRRSKSSESRIVVRCSTHACNPHWRLCLYLHLSAISYIMIVTWHLSHCKNMHLFSSCLPKWECHILKTACSNWYSSSQTLIFIPPIRTRLIKVSYRARRLPTRHHWQYNKEWEGEEQVHFHFLSFLIWNYNYYWDIDNYYLW
jgi:hypothetical protein